MDRIRGHVWIVGDHIDTDLISSVRRFTEGPEIGARHLFEDVLPEFYNEFKAGDIVVAGANFGCGSAQTYAADTLKRIGVGAILACSFARIFYRTAVATGIPVLEINHITELFSPGDIAEIDLEKARVLNVTRDETVKGIPLYKEILETIESGGIVERMRVQNGY